MERAGKQTKEYPAITMDSKGVVTRWTLAPGLPDELEAKKATSGELIPTPRGLLVHVPGWRSQGAGLYAQGRHAVRKIWCEGSSPPGDPKCSMSHLVVSPDGCRVAFAQKDDYPRTVRVLDLCEGQPRR